MTTATPTLDPLAEPLLDVPGRRVCQVLDRPHPDGEPCGKPATWAVTFMCGAPHNKRELVLLCDDHKLTRVNCSVCRVPLFKTRMEPL